MNTSSKLIAITVIGVLIVAGLPTLQSEETEEEYYEVTRYTMRGFAYTEETIKVSKVDAEEIQKAFEGIDSSLSCDKVERKRDVLVEYGLIKNDHMSNKLDVIQNKSQHDTALIMADIQGFFGPSVINLISFLIWSPIFSATAFGINAQYESMLGPGEVFDFTSNGLVLISFLMFFGALIVFPFVSPGGYMNGFTFFGVLQELI